MDRLGRSRRQARDWLVDLALFLGAAAYGLVISGLAVEDPSSIPDRALFTLDQVVGVAACVSLWWRRRWPLQISVALVAVAAFSETASGAMLIGLFSVALYQGLRAGTAVFGLSMVSALVSVSWRPEPAEGRWLVFAVGCALHLAATGWGVALHQRRSLLQALRDRAEQAEAQVELRAAEARRENRDDLAREIHDVLGHRLSLLSVHAGALAYRRDPDPAEVRQAAGVIRQSAHEALQDLRDVIGVLRAPVLDRPQPALRDLEELVDRFREAGAVVTLKTQVVGDLAATHQRTVYRVVQEGLTNAYKHAPSAEIDVRVEGTPTDGVTVRVLDDGRPAAARAATTQPADGHDRGHGLTGLTERASLIGGRIEYGPVSAGGWVLTAWLPWPS